MMTTEIGVSENGLVMKRLESQSNDEVFILVFDTITCPWNRRIPN